MMKPRAEFSGPNEAKLVLGEDSALYSSSMSVFVTRAAVGTFALAALGCSAAPGVQDGAGQGGAASSSASTSASIDASAGSGSGGSGGSGGALAAGGQGGQGGEPCMNTDPGEPNDTEATAYNLGATDCSDSTLGKIYGILAGPEDVDWFTYNGKSGLSCQVDPTSGVSVTTGIARVCAYFACVHGTGTHIGSCPAATHSDTSPSGRPGCCGTTDFTVNLDCEGTSNDESLVYLRVDDPTKGSVCADYAVTFHY
jgi:hypothetical protein